MKILIENYELRYFFKRKFSRNFGSKDQFYSIFLFSSLPLKNVIIKLCKIDLGFNIKKLKILLLGTLT